MGKKLAKNTMESFAASPIPSQSINKGIRESGCLAAGVNAINAYIVEGRKPEDYVEYAKKYAAGAGDLSVCTESSGMGSG